MISRRNLIRLSASVATAASAAKAFAARLPGINVLPQVKAADASRAGGDALKGKILFKDDPLYEIQRRGATWNPRKPNRYPSAIVVAEDHNDVIAAVKLAKQRGWQVTARSGGHAFNGSHSRDNAVMVNLSKMKELSVDAKNRTAVASPAWFGDQLNAVLAKDNLIFPTAHDPGVGIGGFIMCGGHSTISRLYGPACASLRGADIVTADGEMIHADDKQNTDYFWAIRGSGPGFFGVAVRYYLNLHPLPTVRKMSIWGFDAEYLDDLVVWIAKTQTTLPKSMEIIFVSNMTDGKPSLTLIGSNHAFSDQEASDGLKLMESCPVLGKAKFKRLGIPYGGPKMSSTTRKNIDGVWTSAPGDKILAAGRDVFLKLPSPESTMLWMHWGPVQKLPDMAYSLQADTYLSPSVHYQDVKDDARCAAWVADAIAKFRPIANGSQMNDENMPQNKGPYLSPQASARLGAMRKKHDPQNRFAGFVKG